MTVSMHCTYPPSSPGLLPWRHLHDCSVISALAQPYSCLIQILLLRLFTPGPFCCVPPFIPLRNRAHPPVCPLTFSTCPDFSSFFTRTCTCINKAVVSRTEIYVTLILSLPRSPPLPLCLQDTAGRSPTFVMLHERTPTSSEGCVNSVEGK